MLRQWIDVLALLLVLAVPLVVDLDRRNPRHWMEGAALASSQETWFNLKAGDGGAWLRPTLNGGNRRNKPPLLVWWNLLAWADLEPETSTPTQLMHRARLVAAAMGLVLVLGVYGMGRTLQGHRAALIAAGVAGTLPFLFQDHARLASYDIHMVAWATVASAAILWAWRPFAERASRRRAAWGAIIAGLALGFSILSKNPLGLAALALLLIPLACLDRRYGRLRIATTAGMLATALATAAPWYVYHVLRDPAVWDTWTHEFSGVDANDFEGPHLLKLIRFSLPWTFWFVAGLLHPFIGESGTDRRRALVPWLWFLLVLIALSAHKGNAPRYLLPILPAMALVVGQVIEADRRAAQKGRRSRGMRFVAIDHWVALAAASIAVPLLLWSQPALVERGWLAGHVVRPITLSLACMLSAILLALTGSGAWWGLRRHPGRGAMVTAIWLCVISTVCWRQFAHTPSPIDACRAEAETIAEILDGRPLRFLRAGAEERLPDLEFLFFLRGTAEVLRPGQIGHYIEHTPGPHYIMADLRPEYDELLGVHGFEAIREFCDEPFHRRLLWKRQPRGDAASGREAP